MGIAGSYRVGRVKRRFEAIGVELRQFYLVNAMVECGHHDLGRERQRRSHCPWCYRGVQRYRDIKRVSRFDHLLSSSHFPATGLPQERR